MSWGEVELQPDQVLGGLPISLVLAELAVKRSTIIITEGPDSPDPTLVITYTRNA